MIAKGDRVRVYPHGSPDKAATGVALLISGNQRSIAVLFEHLPPFAFYSGPIAICDGGPLLIALRGELNGQPCGPWIEVGGGGHYEIEEPDE